MFFRCMIGFHDWIEPRRPQQFGARRYCACCGRLQELVEDGIWNSGDWFDIEPETEEKIRLEEMDL